MPKFIKDITGPGGMTASLVESDSGQQMLLRHDNPQQAVMAQRLKTQGGPAGLMSASDYAGDMGGGAPPEPQGGGVEQMSDFNRSQHQAPQNIPAPAQQQAPSRLQPAPPIQGDVAQWARGSDANAAAQEAARVAAAEPVVPGAPQAAGQPLPSRQIYRPGVAGREAGFVDRSRRLGPQTSEEAQGRLSEARHKALDVRMGQLEVAGEERKAAAQEQYKQSLAETVIANEQVEEAETRKRTIQQGHDAAMAEVQRTKEEADIEIDPDRFMKSKGTWGQIASRISMALGGYLAGKRGGPNLAAQSIRQKIQDDINAQKEDWKIARSKNQDAKNAFSEYVKIHGTPEAASAALEVRIVAQAKAQAAQSSAASNFFDPRGAQAQKAELAKQGLFAEFDRAEAEAMAKYSQEKTGQLTQEYDQGQSARRGGMGQMTPQEYNRMLKLQVSNREQEALLRGEPSKAEQKESRKEVTSYARDLQSAGVPEYNAAIQKVYDAIGEAEASGDEGAGVGPIAGRAPNFLLSDAGSKVRQAIVDAGDRNLRDRSGAVVSEGEANREMLMVASKRGPEALRIALSQLASRSDSISTNLGRGYGENVVDEYNRRSPSRSKVQAGVDEGVGFSAIE